MGLIKIDKGIPMPPKTHARTSGFERRYRWAEMEIGDSFEFLPEIVVKSARSIASKRASSDGRKYRVHRDEETGVIRCWRIE